MQDFETPTATENLKHDFSKNPLDRKQPIVFAAGKLEQVSAKMYFEGKVPPGDLLCGFKYYDPVAKTKVELNQFTAFVVGVYYGSFSNGKERGEINYQSNLVADTRTDVMHSFFFSRPPGSDEYKIQTLAIGNYRADIAPAIENEGRGSSYTKIIVAYVQELDEIRAFHLGATAEAGFVKAIAKSQGVPEHKASLYRIGELSSEIWAFTFNGEFEPVVFSPKDARNVGATVLAEKGAKTIFFQPVIAAGVIRQTSEKWRETYNKVAEMQLEFLDYIESEQTYLRERLAKKSGQPVQQAQPAPTYTPEPQYRETTRPAPPPMPTGGFPDEQYANVVAAENGDDTLPF